MAGGALVSGRLHQVAVKANDIEASLGFYQGLLGLRLIARFDPPGIAFLDLNGTRLMLAANAAEGQLYFAVPDLDAAVAAVEAKGGSFEQKPILIHRDEAGQFGGKGEEEWMAFLRDPSGNLVGLAARKR